MNIMISCFLQKNSPNEDGFQHVKNKDGLEMNEWIFGVVLTDTKRLFSDTPMKKGPVKPALLISKVSDISYA